jgi:hypothetical protein
MYKLWKIFNARIFKINPPTDELQLSRGKYDHEIGTLRQPAWKQMKSENEIDATAQRLCRRGRFFSQDSPNLIFGSNPPGHVAVSDVRKVLADIQAHQMIANELSSGQAAALFIG